MCGIAGILYKSDAEDGELGKALIDMLDGCQHRGPDSTGFAVYGRAVAGRLGLRFFVGAAPEATIWPTNSSTWRMVSSRFTGLTGASPKSAQRQRSSGAIPLS